MKIALVVPAAKDVGAEVIPYLKVWAVLPAAVLLTSLYAWLSNHLSRDKVFYTMISFFLIFFTFFIFVLYPYRESLELTQLAEWMYQYLPLGLRGFIEIVRHWHLSLFYVLAELWSATVLSMLFWGFANEVTTVDEAKRFYAIFALGANASSIFSGQSAQWMTLHKPSRYIPYGITAWEQSLFVQLMVVILLGIVVMLLFGWLSRHVVAPCDYVQKLRQPEHKQLRLSLIECFTHLLKSPPLRYITILVVAYNIVYNLADFLWTTRVYEYYSNPSDLNAYINEIASLTGVFATIFGLVLSGNVIRRYGWTITAVITPFIWLITSIGFLGCQLVPSEALWVKSLQAFLSMPLGTIALWFGSAQICLGRAAKYTLFDETKEIAFIPLSQESKRKGKAVVDGIASRFGKSGGAILVQILLIISGEVVPYITLVFLIVIGGWLFAVRGLGRLLGNHIDEKPASR
jgi:AAA family ATP:ADP antiporter